MSRLRRADGSGGHAEEMDVPEARDAVALAQKAGFEVWERCVRPGDACVVGTRYILVDPDLPRRQQQSAVARALVGHSFAMNGVDPTPQLVALEASYLLAPPPWRLHPRTRMGASFGELYARYPTLCYDLLVARLAHLTGQVATLWRDREPTLRIGPRASIPRPPRAVERQLMLLALRTRGMVRGPGRARAERVSESAGPDVITLIDPPSTPSA